MKRAKTVDDYVKNADYWQDELVRLRQILTATELTEEIKWGAPCYTYEGTNVVGLGSFKSYFGLWFHQGALLTDPNEVLINAQEGKTKALRQWRMKRAAEIKPRIIKRYLKEAVQLAKDGKSIVPRRNKPIVVPRELSAALDSQQAAAKKFEKLTPGRRREFANYVAEAKREETRLRRVAKVLPMIKAGRGLNDKYR